MKQQRKPPGPSTSLRAGKTSADVPTSGARTPIPTGNRKKGPLVEEDVAAERSHHYAAGADGTQMVSEPEGAAPTGEEPTEEER